MSNLIRKRLVSFLQSLVDENTVDTHPKHVTKSPKDPMKHLANAVAAKIEDGNIKAAIRILCSDDRPANDSIETLEALRMKHPPSPLIVENLVTPEQLGCPPLQVSESDVRAAISSFPCGSAGGPDGITAQHLKDLTAAGVDDSLIGILTVFVNLLLAGKIPKSISPILFGGKLIALEKKDGGIRPIAIGYVWRRLSAKCANHYALDSVTSMLSPTQLGVGIKGGAEAAVHATRRYLQEMPKENLVAKLDFRNAFNSLMRNQMLDAIARVAPEIYSVNSILSSGNHEVVSSEGPQQGDPLGPLMFSITIQPILDKLNSELVIGYLDDITLGGGVHQVAADIEIVVKDAEAMGLILNANKCELISFESENIPPITTFDNYQLIKPNDAILLGAPILPGPAVDTSLKSKFDTLKKAIERMQYIDAHDALLLLKSSLHLPKLLYILRTSVCHGNPILDDIDDITREGLSNILNLPFSDDNWRQANLPVKDGGLGVRSVASLASSAFLASAASTNDLQLSILVRTHIVEDQSKASALEQWLDATKSVEPIGDASHIQKNWEKPGIEETKSSLLSNCNDDRDRARLLASRAVHSGEWLNALPISSCGLRMGNDVIRAAVAFRIGNRLCEPHPCRCGSLVDAFGTHGLSCNKSAAAGRQLRHHLLNDIIWRALSRANIPSTKEPLGLHRTDAKRPDGVTLTAWQAGKCLLWDATSPDTQAASHLNGTSKKAGAAAEQAANLKIEKYRELIPKYLFVPIAVETLGPINEEGANFLCDLGSRIEKITQDRLEKCHIFQRISVAVQRGNALSFAGCFPEEVSSWD